MDPDVMVTILFVAYAVIVAIAIGGLLLSQNERRTGADDDASNPAGYTSAGACQAAKPASKGP